MKRRIEQIERLSSLTVRRGHSRLGPITALGQRVVLTGDDARVHLEQAARLNLGGIRSAI